MVAEIKPVMLVIDTLGRAKGAFRENYEEEVGRLFSEWFPRIVERTQTTIVVVHHQGHEGDHRARGTSAMRPNVDHEYETHSTDFEGKLSIVTLTHLRAKDAERERPLRFTATRSASSIVLVHQKAGADESDETDAEKVAEAVRSLAETNLIAGESRPIKTTELVAETGISSQRLSEISDHELAAVGVVRHRPGNKRGNTYTLR
jgi:hypothetical protein